VAFDVTRFSGQYSVTLADFSQEGHYFPVLFHIVSDFLNLKLCIIYDEQQHVVIVVLFVIN